MIKMTTNVDPQSYKIISEAFNRALENLQIDPKRFRSLPIHQRKLAIQEAIYKTANIMAKDIDWISDRSGFYDKKIWDFSTDEIRLHQTIVDVYTAFACLGMSNSILPLITYMGFPEQRWSIAIEPVLRVLFRRMLEEPIFRIPTSSDKYHWRYWGISHSDHIISQDFTNILLAEIGPEVVNQNSQPSKNTENINIELILKQEHTGSVKKYFNDSQANYCSNYLYPELKKGDLHKFAYLLDLYLDQHEQEKDIFTIESCINDQLNQSDLSKKNVRNFWLKSIHSDDLKPRTWVLLYKASLSEDDDIRLAKTFAKKIVGEDARSELLLAICDILTKSSSKKSIYQLAYIFEHLELISEKQSINFLSLKPEIFKIMLDWISNIISTETESICLLGSEQPAKRDKLLKIFSYKFEDNDEQLCRIFNAKKSSDDSYREFSMLVNELYIHRQPLKKQIHRKANISNLTALYNKFLRDFKEILFSTTHKFTD